MKENNFLTSFLGSLTAIWATVAIGVILVFIFVGMIVAAVGVETSKIDDSVLKIELSGAIPERVNDVTVSEILSGAETADYGLDDILTAIHLAATDSKIKGIYLECAGSELGLASRQEIIEALAEFRQSGKWVYAYADIYAQGDYFVATAADSIFVNPVGMVDVHGLAAQVLFFKDLMDKLGIEMQIVKVGSYKSAVEPFIRMDMSEPSREQTAEFVNGDWNTVAEIIADNRHVSIADVNIWADSLSMTWAPERYLSAKIVDALEYRYAVEDRIRELIDIDDDDDIPFVAPDEYVLAKASELNTAKKHIAVLYAVGDIVDSGKGGIVGPDVVEEIEKITDDDDVAGLILRVNSGGGSAFASEQIWEALERFKATDRPFYVSMGDYAASGGYYISCGADYIVADPTTLTGSIGIFGMIPNASRLLKDKIGLGFETVTTSPNANFPSVWQAASTEQLDAMQEYVSRGYELFTSRVAQGREIPQDSVKAIGGGRVWTGTAAIDLGLVDALGSLQNTIETMASDLDLSVTDIKIYPEREDKFMNVILRKLASDVAIDEPMLGASQPISAEECRDLLDLYRTVMTASPLQARIPYITLK